MLAFASAELVAQNSPAAAGEHSTVWTRVPPSNHALGEHVTRPYGDYQYLPQKGLYKNVTIGDAVEDFGFGYNSISAKVNSLNQYAGWNTRTVLADDIYLRSRVGLAAFPNFPMPGIGWGNNSFNGPNPDRFTIVAGPLVLDSFYAGFAALYSDLEGTIPGYTATAPDDRWVYMVWLSFRATLLLGESISLSLQPYLYWIPTTGGVGWALPGPYAGLAMMPQLGSVAMFELTWAKEVGNWKFAAYDQFSPWTGGYTIWNSFLGGNASWGDLSPVDRVGRYQLGYGLVGDTSNFNPFARFGLTNSNFQPLAAYYNLIGFRAYGTHGYGTNSMFYLDRADMWDKNFYHRGSTLLGGAYLRSGSPYFSTYAGYNFVTSEPYESVLHSAVAGARKVFSDTLSGYAEAGYFWNTGGTRRNGEGWLGLVGLQQRLGNFTAHAVEVGRRVYRPIASAPGVEDFAEYRIQHQLGMRTSIVGLAGVSKRHVQSTVENDYGFKYAGLILNTQVTPRISAYGSAGWEKAEMEATDLVYERWLYRLGLNYSMTESIRSQCYYQYEDVNGNRTNYHEHFIYLGISKAF